MLTNITPDKIQRQTDQCKIKRIPEIHNIKIAVLHNERIRKWHQNNPEQH